MVSPAKRRAATAHVMATFEVSQRRACRVLGTSRSSQRRGDPPLRAADDLLRQRLRHLARQRPRFGYRRLCALLRAEGHEVNHKRVARLCREEGLRVRGNARKRRRAGTSTPGGERLVATAANQVWAIDFQFDTTSDGRTLKLCNVTDEFTREALAIDVGRGFDADATVAVLDRIASRRGAPQFVRCDNGPELTAAALRDWCRFNAAGTSYIDPGAPWQNAYVESFNGRLRDDLLSCEVFDTLTEAKVLLEDWRIDYNWNRPHSALGNQPPAKYAATLKR
jgi:putative transposase